MGAPEMSKAVFWCLGTYGVSAVFLAQDGLPPEYARCSRYQTLSGVFAFVQNFLLPSQNAVMR